MEFYVWHILAIVAVIAVSFAMGYITGKQYNKKYNGTD